MAKMVGAKVQFEAVLGGRSLRATQAGVVDQQVDFVVIGPQSLGCTPNGRQRGQVEFLQGNFGAGVALDDKSRGLFALVETAYGHHNVGALGGERGGGLVTQPSVGAGDNGDAAGLVGDVGG